MKYINKLVSAFVGLLTCLADFGPQDALAFQSAQDLRAKRYIIMAFTAANQVSQATDPTSSLLAGVLQNKPNSLQAATVAYQGKSKIVAGGSLNANDIITTNSSGKAAKVASGQMAIGRVLEAATNDNDIINCVLMEPVRWTGAA